MSKVRMDLRDVVEKSADADLMCKMIGFAGERLMEFSLRSPRWSDRRENRSARRRASAMARTAPTGRHSATDTVTGRRIRQRQTSAGTVDLRIPKLRTGSYFPSFFAPRRAIKTGLIAVAMGLDPRRHHGSL
jgi:hypothetical protein